MENVHVNEAIDGIKDIANKAAEDIKAKAEEAMNAVKHMTDAKEDAEQTSEAEHVSGDVIDEAEDEKAKKRFPKVTGKKVAIAVGVGALVAGACIIARKDPVKYTYNVTRLIL